ncbi:MAG TPA: hypothetical protein VFB77_05465 [Acidimicrobiales bacterium]|nr:hypothetical protein [Acidimicrobiales bacterium]
MSALTRVGKALWATGKGGWHLRRAAQRAERSEPQDGDAAVADVETLDIQPTLPQAALLVRYIAGRFVLGWIETVLVTEYVLLAGALTFLVGWPYERDGVTTFVGVFLLMLFVLAVLAQRAATRAVRRVGALDKLAGLDDFAFDALIDWWPNLRAEFRRVGLSPSAWSMLRLGTGYATGRLSDDQRGRLEAVRWLAVIPAEQLNDAHQVLVRAAA